MIFEDMIRLKDLVGSCKSHYYLNPFRYSKAIPNIGHGGFICQHLTIGDSKLNIIFDCGSKSQDLLRSAIGKESNEIESYLVISHFHDDHINGIELISKFNITKVFIPDICLTERIIIASTMKSIVAQKFTLNPKEIFPHSEVIHIRADNNSETNNDYEHQSFNHTETYRISFGDAGNSFFWWTLKFYIVKSIYSIHLCVPKITNIKSYSDFVANQDVIKNFYSKKANDINKTSMMMLCYPETSFDENHLFNVMKEDGGLLLCTGDSEISSKKKRDELVNHYKPKFDMITELILPHHGAYKNCKCLPLKKIRQAYVQSRCNDVHHPSTQTIDLLNANSVKLLTHYKDLF